MTGEAENSPGLEIGWLWCRVRDGMSGQAASSPWGLVPSPIRGLALCRSPACGQQHLPQPQGPQDPADGLCDSPCASDSQLPGSRGDVLTNPFQQSHRVGERKEENTVRVGFPGDVAVRCASGVRAARSGSPV